MIYETAQMPGRNVDEDSSNPPESCSGIKNTVKFMGRHASFIEKMRKKFLGLTKKIASFVKSILEKDQLEKNTKELPETKIASVADIPFTIVNIGSSIQEGIEAKNPEEKAEASLKSISKFGDIVDSVAKTAAGIHAIREISSAVEVTMPLWISVLGYVSLGLKLCGIAIDSIGLITTYRIGEKLKKSMVVDGPEGQRTERERVMDTLQLLVDQEPSVLKKRLRVKDPGLLKERIKEYVGKIQDEDGKSLEEAQILIEKLRDRVKRNICNHALKIVAQTVSLVALAILLFTPAAPVALALFIVGAVFSVTVSIKSYVEDKRFSSYLQKRPDDKGNIRSKVKTEEPDVLEEEERLRKLRESNRPQFARV